MIDGLLPARHDPVASTHVTSAPFLAPIQKNNPNKKKTSMKTNSSLFRTTGIFLAVLLSFALASPDALAVCGQCDDVTFELYYGSGTTLALEMECAYPTGAYIFYTVTWNTPNNLTPTRDSAGNPGSNTYKVPSGTLLYIPYGDTAYVNAFAWKSCYYNSINITSAEQHNPNG